MQNAARQHVEERYSRERMLQRYHDLCLSFPDTPRKKRIRPAAWMEPATAALLFRASNPSAVTALMRYLGEPEPPEPHFLQHPAGKATVAYVLSSFCPELIRAGKGRLVERLCRHLRASRCVSPLMDALGF